MSDLYELYDEPDLDTVKRDQLRDGALGGMPGDVADVLDDWLHQCHGVTSSHHGVGTFLDMLAAAGYRVTPIVVPAFAELLPASAD